MRNFWILQKGLRSDSASGINYICYYLESIEKDKFPILKIDNQYRQARDADQPRENVRLYVMIKLDSPKASNMVIRYFGHVSVLKNSIGMIYFKNFVQGHELRHFEQHMETDSAQESQQQPQTAFGKWRPGARRRASRDGAGRVYRE